MSTLQQITPFPSFARIAVRPSPRSVGMLALVGANVIWGGSAAASKAALVHLPPFTLASLRVAVALLVLLGLLAWTGRRPATGRGPALLGLTGVALFCASQNLGLQHSSAATTALLNGAIPILTAFLAVIALGERLGGWRLVGLTIAFAGIGVIVAQAAGTTGGTSALGNLLPLVSAVSFAVYALIGRRVFAGGDALGVVAGSTGYGLLVLLPVGIGEAALKGIGPIAVRDVGLVLFLGAGCSALAFVLAGYGMGVLDAGQAAVFGNIKPLVGVGLAVALLGEQVSGGQGVGGALVILGIGIAGRQVAGRISRTAPVMGPEARLMLRHATTMQFRLRPAHRSDGPWMWSHNHLADLAGARAYHSGGVRRSPRS
ncbi:MAG: DMT family transporter [Thermomicrobiales bacterium]|nr:DMT family transporter [Thermomicrobiales bacterium]